MRMSQTELEEQLYETIYSKQESMLPALCQHSNAYVAGGDVTKFLVYSKDIFTMSPIMLVMLEF